MLNRVLKLIYVYRKNDFNPVVDRDIMLEPFENSDGKIRLASVKLINKQYETFAVLVYDFIKQSFQLIFDLCIPRSGLAVPEVTLSIVFFLPNSQCFSTTK